MGRVKRGFSAIGRGFGNAFRAIGRFFVRSAPVIVALFLVGLIVINIYGAYIVGRWEEAYRQARGTVIELKQTLDRAARQQTRVEYERDVCQAAFEEVTQQCVNEIERCEAEKAVMMPVGAAFWCEGMMPLELVPPEIQSLAVSTAAFVKSLPSDVPPLICIDFVSVLGSEVRGEVYVLVSRNFGPGNSDRLIIYFQKVPGEQDKYRVIEFYDVIERERHFVEPTEESKP